MWYIFRYFDRYILFFIEEIFLILRLNFIVVVKNWQQKMEDIENTG